VISYENEHVWTMCIPKIVLALRGKCARY
jgi:hypothetical protein